MSSFHELRTIDILRMNNRPVGGLSSETQSQPIDIPLLTERNEWPTILLRIRRVPGSNLGQGTT
jgi:hypothetical protein